MSRIAVAEKKIHIFPPPPILLRNRPHARCRAREAEMELGDARAFTTGRIDRIWDMPRRGARVERESAGDGLSFVARVSEARGRIAQSMYDVVGPRPLYQTKTPLDRLAPHAIT